jgi:hypothetical protein
VVSGANRRGKARLIISSCTIEMSMVASHLVWLLRTRAIRRRAREAGETFDESQEGLQWQAQGVNLEKRILRLLGRGSRHAEGTDSGLDSADTLAAPAEAVPKAVPIATYGAV